MPSDQNRTEADLLERCWRWLKRRAPRSAGIAALVLASAAVLDWVSTGFENVEKVGVWLGIRSDPQKDLALLIAKGQYPLEPLSAYFDVEFQMSDPEIVSYARRLQVGLVAWLRQMREGRGHTSDDLHDEDMLFVIRNIGRENPGLTPGAAAGEGLVKQALLDDGTMLIFSDARVTQNPENTATTIRFFCMPASMQDVFVTLPRVGDVEQKVELFADFKRRIFIKHVQCNNLPRLGPNSTARSAFDLVGRRLSLDSTTWSGDPRRYIVGNISKIAIVFPFNSHADDYEQRYIHIEPGEHNIVLDEERLGLKGLIVR
jgi:hypothetical protein